MNSFFRDADISDSLQRRIRGYFAHVATSRDAAGNDAQVLEMLPPQYRADVSVELTKSIVESVPMFAKTPEQFVRRVCQKLEPRLYQPDDVLMLQGDEGDEMLFILSGSVAVDVNGMQVAVLGGGSFLGEGAVVGDGFRNATCKAASFCRVYVLKKEDLEDIAKIFPGVMSTLREVSDARQKSNAIKLKEREEKERKSSEALAEGVDDDGTELKDVAGGNVEKTEKSGDEENV